MPKNQYEPGQYPQPRAGKSRAGKQVRLGLESLEDRNLLSGAASSMLSLDGVAVGSHYDASHILVQFREGAMPHASTGTSLGPAVSASTGLYEIQLQTGVTVADALAAYRSDATVKKAEPDYQLETAAIPSDARFGEQWSLHNSSKPGADINAEAAWDITHGSTRLIVAIDDTGINYTHRDLYKNIWINQNEIPESRLANLIDVDGDGLITFRDLNDSRNQGYRKITDLNGNGYIDGGDLLYSMSKDSGQDTGWGGWADGIDQGGNGYVDDLIGWNFFNNNNNPDDDFGHGTHVAGTIGAAGNNDLGVAGIAWDVQLMPIRFLGSGGGGSVSQFIAGLNYAVANGARISNNSWAGAAFSTMLTDAIDNARSRGHIFVAAAGNYGTDNDSQPTYPASFKLDNVVSVAATDRNYNLASFSDYGKNSVQLAAPGVDILSTTPGNDYGYLSGTSMATPHVTGVLALVWSLHPDWSYKQVIDKVLTSVDKLPSLQDKTITGGRLDAAAALSTASVASTLHIVDSVATGPTANSLSKITVKFDRAVNPSTFSSADVFLVGADGGVINVWGVNAIGGGTQSFELTFDTQTNAGYYKLRVGPDVRDWNGNGLVTFYSDYYLKAGSTPAPTPTPGPATLHIVDSVATGPSANSLDKITVKFDRPVNASTFSPSDVFLVGADGSVINVNGVNAVGGNQVFELTFATQTNAGYYKLRVGPDVQDQSGNTLVTFYSSFYIQGGSTPTPTPSPSPSSGHFVSSEQVNVPTGGRGGSMISVGQNLTIHSVKIKLNLTHPHLGDLLIHVQAPDGTNVTLSNRKGGPTANMFDTVFDDNADTHVALGRGPYSGSFQPDSSLSNLNGKNAQGVWKLWVEDKVGSAQGTLNSWEIIVS